MTNWYQNLGFRWKLTLPLILLVVLFIYVGLYAVRSSQTLASHAEVVAGTNLPEIELLLQADRDLYQALSAERALLTGQWTDEEWKGLEREHAENVEQSRDRVMQSFALSDTATATEREEFLRLLDAWVKYSSGLVQQAATAGEGADTSGLTDEEALFADEIVLRSDLLEQSFNEGYATFTNLRNFIDQVGDRRMNHIERLTQTINDDSQRITRQLILCVVAGTLVIMLAAWLLPLLVTVPLKTISGRIRNIAEGDGDLTIRINIDRQDELGELAGNVNLFMEKLQKLIGEIRSNSEEVSGAAEFLLTVSGSSEQAADEQCQAITMVVAAVNELTVAIQEVARNTGDTAQSAREANTTTEMGQTRIRTAVDRVKHLSAHITTTADIMVRLEQEARQVTSVIDVIRGVAEQTNLLALNAAIEAARAGESGRGFAVVADEVRTLASRTQQSTTDIQGMLSQLQAGVQKAVEAMNASASMTDDAVVAANEAGESLAGIASAVQNITNMSIQIATAAEEQSSVTAEIDKNLVGINQLATSTSGDAGKTASASQQLNQLSVGLRQLLGSFRI